MWYNEYYKCVAEKGADDAECKAQKHKTKVICPDEWCAGPRAHPSRHSCLHLAARSPARPPARQPCSASTHTEY